LLGGSNRRTIGATARMRLKIYTHKDKSVKAAVRRRTKSFTPVVTITVNRAAFLGSKAL
jgi:hypothetical protein